MWNNLNPEGPLQDLCEYGTATKDKNILQELPDLVSLLTTSAEIMTEDHAIWTEINIFKNIQAKYKRILHCDKCLQLLQRVGGYLQKMVLLNLSKVYLDLAEKMLVGLQNKNSSHFIPSRQQLEYALIRTQTAAKLICEALHYSRETFCYLIQRLKVGHLILHLMMATSVTARLNIVLKGLLVQIFEVYKKMYLWRKKLRKGGWEWPCPLELPEDLEEWINNQESEYLKPKLLPREQLDFLTSIFEAEENGNGTKVQEEIDISIDKSESNGNVELDDDGECIVVENDDTSASVDEGVPLSRSKVKKNHQKLSNSQRLLLKKIKSADDMRGLRIIWDNIDVTSQDLLPKALTPIKIRLIDKVFLTLKRRISQLNESVVPAKEKEKEIKSHVKVAGLKFAKHLGILATMKENVVDTQDEFQLKPVKTFKELKRLYDIIYQKLQSAQEYEKCAKLKKSFKSRKADIKLLVENDEKVSAKRLICGTSKFFLSEFLNFQN